jgi:hypothetical protein
VALRCDRGCECTDVQSCPKSLAIATLDLTLDPSW